MSRLAFGGAAIWAVVVVLAVHTLQFPGSGSDFTGASRGGVLLDAVPAFGADAVYGRLAGYGEAGRNTYSFRNVSVDIVLPLSVPFLFLLARRALTARSIATWVRLWILSVPIAYVVFDLLENASVLVPRTQEPSRGESSLCDADQKSGIATGVGCPVGDAERSIPAQGQRDRLR